MNAAEPLDLAIIEARLNSATPGPWWWRNTQDVYLQGARTRIVMAFARRGMNSAQPQFRNADGFLDKAGDKNLRTYPDAELIAHAPEDLAALLAEVKRLREQEQRLNALAAEHWDWKAGRVLHERLQRVLAGGPCCDMHNRHCEPPSELCCGECTEAHHGLWPPVAHMCVLDGAS